MDRPAAPAVKELPRLWLPSLARDLGFIPADRLATIDRLLPVQDEEAQLPGARCAVCRLAAMELFSTAARHWLAGTPGWVQGHRAPKLAATAARVCERAAAARTLGVSDSRAGRLQRLCKQLATPEWTSRLARLAGELESERLEAWPLLDRACAESCTGRAVPRWAAVVEWCIGLEPLGMPILADQPISSPDQLLHFAAAKGDLPAVRLLGLLSGANTASLQRISPETTATLRRELARLLPPPAAKQQLALLRQLMPGASGGSELETVVAGTQARFELRVGQPVNDTALHAAAHSYDQHTLLELLALAQRGAADTRDSHGRTALHYAADAHDQLLGLVSAFAEPPERTSTLLEQRTGGEMRMAADYPQEVVVERLAEAQLSTVRLLLAYGADPNSLALSGCAPLHLAARSGAARVVERLIAAGATVDARNRHGATSLALAAAAGHARVVKILLDNGASPQARDGSSRPAYSYGTAGALPAAETERLFGLRPEVPAKLAAPAGVVSESGWGQHDSDPRLGLMPDFCQIDRRSADLAPSAFEREYLHLSRPVLIKGAASGMPAKRLWGRAAFLKRVARQAFDRQKLPVPTKGVHERFLAQEAVRLDEYLEQAVRGEHAKPLGWNLPQNKALWAEMEQELSWPASLASSSVQRLASFGLFLGPQGSGTSMHYHRAAWNALLFGRKLWVLTPPASSRFYRKEMAVDTFARLEPARLRAAVGNSSNDEARLFCIQQEDDVIFVPSGWGHATLCLNESVSVASFFLDEEASGFKPTRTWHTRRGMRSIQTAVGISAPSDYDSDGHEQ